MRLFVRLLGGLAAVTLVGAVWTSRSGPDLVSESRDAAPIERPVSELEARPIEGVPPRATTASRAARNPGGLPARGARTGNAASRTTGTAAAPPPPIAAAIAPAQQARVSPARARADMATAPISTESTDQSSATGQPDAPPEKERSRSNGIGGSVLEKSGAAAPGLQVGLKPRRVFNGAAPAPPQQTTTDARGGFAFSTVADGEYEVFTETNERYESASTLVRAGTDSAVLVVHPKSDTTLAIRGVVESARGGALAGVRIDVMGESISAVTDGKGAYALRVPAGARVEQTALRFRLTGYRDRRWTVADGLRSGDYEVIGDVRLDPDAAGVSVTGVVTSTSGAPVARAQVQLTSSARGRSYRGVSDGDGHFVIANVEAGPGYRLWVRPQSGFKDGLLENVEVGSATLLAVQLTPIGVATLRGRMVTPEGAAVPGFTMSLVTASASKQRASSVTSDGQGRFLVADLAEGAVVLQTRAAPAISVSGIELSAATPDTDVTVVVDVGAHRFEGRLLTSDGEPAAGVMVSLESTASIGGVTSRSSRQTMTDAEGNFAFTQLGGGMHVVSAALAGAGSVRLEQSIGPGMEPIHLTLPGKRGRQ